MFPNVEEQPSLKRNYCCVKYRASSLVIMFTDRHFQLSIHFWKRALAYYCCQYRFL